MQTEGATSSTDGLNPDELQLIKTYFEEQGILSFAEFQATEDRKRTAIACARQEQDELKQDPNYMSKITEILVHSSQPVQDLNTDWDEDGFWTTVHDRDHLGVTFVAFYINGKTREILDVHPRVYFQGIQARTIARSTQNPILLFDSTLPPPEVPDQNMQVPCHSCYIFERDRQTSFRPYFGGDRCYECKHWTCDHCFNEHPRGRVAFPICQPCAMTQDAQEAISLAQDLNVTPEHMNMAREMCKRKCWGTTNQPQRLLAYLALNIMVRETQDRTEDCPWNTL